MKTFDLDSSGYQVSTAGIDPIVEAGVARDISIRPQV